MVVMVVNINMIVNIKSYPREEIGAGLLNKWDMHYAVSMIVKSQTWYLIKPMNPTLPMTALFI